MVDVVGGSDARKVIRGSRLKALLMLLISGVFVAMSIFGLSTPQLAGGYTWPIIGVLFGLGVPIFLDQAVWPEALILDRDGFTLRVLWRTHKRKWSDIEEFLLWSPANGSQMVGYNYKPDRRPKGMLTQISRRLACDAGLPGGWKMAPRELLTTLQEWKGRYG